jgi:hypothetical protein
MRRVDECGCRGAAVEGDFELARGGISCHAMILSGMATDVGRSKRTRPTYARSR